ncbi:putative zinc-binding protein [uncultured Dysgonomonas sp.]|uniref:putative zinc-binding protein n=1 Tax=uncultured Dysgonomonas sp. TaxID=206096 RepID=UPI00261178AF|nr:putative zinc-binding protein [uncultured Dysgonomonas sp.]
MCEDFAKEQIENKKPIAVLSCEGACLRGEIARQAANIICFKLSPEKTSRICLGGAFTKNTGQRNLVRSTPKVLALEGCFIKCSSRMMKGVIDELNPEIVVVDTLCDFDKKLFAINDLAEEKIRELATNAANKIVEKYLAV